MSGDSAFPFLNGGDPYTVNLVTYNTFTRAGLDSWQLRYDYDFVAMGIPGLSFMTRYTDGRHAKPPPSAMAASASATPTSPTSSRAARSRTSACAGATSPSAPAMA
jgi:hypothetical protein